MDSKSIQKFVDQVKDVSEHEPQNCGNVDVEVFEEVGQNLVSDMKDYLVNVDLTRAQFDVDKLFQEAGRLGMDFGDLEEYGIEVSSSSCGKATACLTKNSIKNFDDAINKGQKFTNKLFIEGLNAYERAQCHDDFRSKVTPMVQGLISTCPLGFCTWPIWCVTEVPSCCFCFCIECPYRCVCQTWWDACWVFWVFTIACIVAFIVGILQLFFLP